MSAEGRRGSRTRRALLGIALGLVGLGLVLAALLTAVSRGWQRERVREGVEQALSAALDAPVEIEALEGPLWPSFAVRGLEVQRIGGVEVLAMRRLEVDLAGYVGGDVPRIALDRVDAEGVMVRVAPDAEGRWPWQGDDGAADEAGTALEIAIAHLVFGDVTVLLADPVRTLRVVLDGEARDVRLGPDPSAARIEARFAAATGPADGAVAGEPEGPWEEWAQGRLAGSFLDGRWEVAEARVEGEVLRAEASGAGDVEGIADARVAFEVPSLAALGERLPGVPPDAAGRVSGSATASGPWDALVGALRADGEGIRVAALEADHVSLHLQSEAPGVLWLETLRIEGEDLGLRATRRARIEPGEETLAIDGLALAMRDGSTLAVDATLPWEALGRPRSLLARGPAARLHVRAAGWSLGELAPLLPAADVGLRGVLDADLTLTRRAGARPTAQGHASLAKGALEAPGLAIAGVDVEVRLAGDPENPSGEASGRLRDVVVRDRPLGAVRFAVHSPGQRVLVVDELVAEGGALPLSVAPGSRFAFGEEEVTLEAVRIATRGQTLHLEGALGRDGRCDLVARAEDLDVAVLADVLSQQDPEQAVDVAGRLGGEIRCGGTLAAPALDGALAWTPARVDVFDFERIEARLESRDGVQHLDGAWVQDGDLLLDVEARAPATALGEPGSLLESPGLRVEARARAIDLAVLHPFLPQATPDLRGPVTGEITLRGGSPSPRLRGQFVLTDGVVEVRPLRDPLAPVALRVTLEDDLLVLRDLRIGTDGAGVTGSGRVRLASDGDATLAARLDFDALPLAVPGLVSGTVDGGLDLGGSVDAPELTGALELARLEISLPEEESAELKEIQILTSDERAPGLEITEQPEAPSWLDPLAMDVGVDVRRNSWVRGRGAEVEIAGDLRLRKRPGRDPRLSGEIETLRGRYDAYGRRFQVQRGRAILDGSWPPDPLLEINAERPIRDVTILASLEGRLSEPRLVLDSIPPMNDTDIASYLVFGRPAADLGAGEQQAVGTVAGRVAAGMAVRELEQIFQGRLPVDVIDVQVEENEGRSEFDLGVGKYIGDRLFIRYGRSFGEEPVDEVRGEVELAPHWSLEGSAASDGTTGADLIFHFDY